jgi:hypothetical protein
MFLHFGNLKMLYNGSAGMKFETHLIYKPIKLIIMITKKLITAFAVFAVLALSTSCKKAEDGATGPTGPAGSNGTNGNSNVKAYYFGKDSITSLNPNITLNLPSPVTSNMIDSSAVLVYHSASGLWFPSPGVGLNSTYQTRIYTQNTTLYVKSLDPDGTAYSGGKVIFDKLKVIVIPASDFSGFRKKPVDFTDYKATMQYYGLAED